MRSIVFLLLILVGLQAIAQKTYSSNGLIIPSDLKECLTQFEVSFSKKAKADFANINEAELSRIKGIYLLNEWSENDSTAFVKCFNRYGLNNYSKKDRDFIVLLAYHRILNKQVFDMEAEVLKITKRNDSIRKLAEKEFSELVLKDTINGVYIPADLYNCMLELDKSLTNEIKQEIRNCNPSDIVATFHMTTGLWIRNNWGLIKGSRLQNHFIEKGIDHADGMSAVILKAYFQYLKGSISDYDNVIKSYLPEFKKMKELIEANERQISSTGVDPESYREFLKTKKINSFSVSKY